MEHNHSVDDKVSKQKQKPTHSETLKEHIHIIEDEWERIPEHDPMKILINEKTVYAIDQAMNVLLTDLNGKILYGNRNVFDLTLYTPEELLGEQTKVFNAGYHTKDFFDEMWTTITSGNIWRGEIKNRRKDGKIIWARMIITPLLDKTGKPFQFIALKEDITDKKEMEFRLAQKDKQLSALTDHSYDIIGITDKEGVILYLNPAFERVLGFSRLETVGTPIGSYIHDGSTFETSMLQPILNHPQEPYRTQIKCNHKDGSVRWCEVVLTNYLDDPHIHGIVFNLRDYTKQKEANDLINHLANYDFLTGLPNRRHFESQLRETLMMHKESRTAFAVLFLDLDGFKNINDTFGHDIGDQLLKEVGHRLDNFFHYKVLVKAFVSRLGGDEFAVIVPEIENDNQLAQLGDSLIQAFQPLFSIGDYEISVSTSIGISVYPISGEDSKALLKNADIAMYKAKKSGKNQFQLFH